eukprot:365875-Chlamydomonas_euryale.AAC.6
MCPPPRRPQDLMCPPPRRPQDLMCPPPRRPVLASLVFIWRQYWHLTPSGPLVPARNIPCGWRAHPAAAAAPPGRELRYGAAGPRPRRGRLPPAQHGPHAHARPGEPPDAVHATGCVSLWGPASHVWAACVVSVIG